MKVALLQVSNIRPSTMPRNELCGNLQEAYAPGKQMTKYSQQLGQLQRLDLYTTISVFLIRLSPRGLNPSTANLLQPCLTSSNRQTSHLPSLVGGVAGANTSCLLLKELVPPRYSFQSEAWSRFSSSDPDPSSSSSSSSSESSSVIPSSSL